ncbi:hypothetical protein M426DRAFT_76064 [Hypoxylon sp. CI-4A]|nr:hypothetical protein M426DRAFT_76064 [Hypoxylon sp. CI-4A]
MELGCSVVTPLAPHKHTHTVIFLHGRGDTSQNAAGSLLKWTRGSAHRSLVDSFPSVRWVFPQAEEREAVTSGEVWNQWFDIVNILDPLDGEDEQLLGLRASVESIRRIVRREARAVGGLEKIVLAGISQGGAAAVHALLHLGGLEDDGNGEGEDEGRLCALMAFSAWLPFPGGSLEETREVLGLEGDDDDEVNKSQSDNDELVRNTPAFLGHCADDSLVFVEFGQQLRDSLRGFGMNVSWNEYSEGGHWIKSPKGVDDAVAFLEKQGIPAAK